MKNLAKNKPPGNKFIIIGLGNPGLKYESTRHNIGFKAVENLNLKIKSFSDWKNNKKLLSQTSQGEIADKKVILAKPQTFMNLSGKAARLLVKNYNLRKSRFAFSGSELKIENLIVIHDEIDLPLGRIKIIKNRGAAGHKGIESIVKELGTKNFIRLRVGIQPSSGKPKNPERFVLQKFSKEEKKIITTVAERTSQAIETLLKQGPEKAMSKHN